MVVGPEFAMRGFWNPRWHVHKIYGRMVTLRLIYLPSQRVMPQELSRITLLWMEISVLVTLSVSFFFS